MNYSLSTLHIVETTVQEINRLFIKFIFFVIVRKLITQGCWEPNWETLEYCVYNVKCRFIGDILDVPFFNYKNRPHLIYKAKSKLWNLDKFKHLNIWENVSNCRKRCDRYFIIALLLYCFKLEVHLLLGSKQSCSVLLN